MQEQKKIPLKNITDKELERLSSESNLKPAFKKVEYLYSHQITKKLRPTSKSKMRKVFFVSIQLIRIEIYPLLCL